ncbi:AMP-binding protein [Sedimentitalea nanhaiensis]|uniref:Phosphopantetheine attachment site n=1 Tax=Sedimentitalea nanhaiensis TaxID=999627 RepID=A0A1I7DL68_9RHOB|nr:AMP-binding protein [Sedimentitalea nanhaiensis]SFU12365.1 Phosphopantetheine attachment site [Sedimentitalea nanhaiensis]
MSVSRLDHLVRIRAKNSLSFLEKAFELYSRSTPFCIERDTIEHPAIQAMSPQDPEPVEERFGWGQLNYKPDFSEAIAQIVFTSGTEGRPKAIAITHRNLADVVVRLNRVMEVDDSIREYIGVPVTYSFGLGRARAVAAAGGAFFLPERFDPSEIARMAAAGEINAISAVPALWRLVLANPGIIGDAGRAIRWIEIGSQAMSAEEKAGMRRLFPNARIVQHYGLTEASRTTFLCIDSAPDDVLGSVGDPTGEVEIEIGPDGSIRIRGPHVATGTVTDDGAILPLVDGDGWLVTKDQGRYEDGVLWYDGRLDDQINVAGIKVGAEALEARVRELIHAKPGSFAIGAGSDALRGEIVLLAVVQMPDVNPALVEEATRIALRERGVEADGALRRIEVSQLPTTGTDKVQRRRLRDLVPVPPAGPVQAEQVDLSPEQARIAKAWRRVVGDTLIRPDDSFYDLGGDSLSAMQIGLTMESDGYPNAVVKGTLEGRTLAELAGAEVRDGFPDATIRSWALNLVRGLMVLSVLFAHWAPGVFARLGLEEATARIMGPFYRMGTPGFATVFGLGLGFFLFPNVLDRPAAVRRRLRQSWLLVGAAALLLALVLGLRLKLYQGHMLSAEQIAVLFYGVLTFYLVALALAFPVMRLIARRDRPYADCLLGAVLLWSVYLMLRPLMPPDSLGSPLELLKLLAVGHYSVPRIGGLVLLGLAAGIWYARQTEAAKAARTAAVTGAGIAAVAVLIGIEHGGIQALADPLGGFHRSLAGYVFYAALVVTLLGLATRAISHWSSWPGGVRTGLKFLIVTGALALPIYAFHGAVIPVADIGKDLGVPGGIAIAVPMGLFLSGIGWLGLRVWRMYFGVSVNN